MAFSQPHVNLLDDFSHLFITQIINDFPFRTYCQTRPFVFSLDLVFQTNRDVQIIPRQSVRVRSLHDKQILCHCHRSR